MKSFRTNKGEFITLNGLDNTYSQYTTLYGYLIEKELLDIDTKINNSTKIVNQILNESNSNNEINEIEKNYLCYLLIRYHPDGKKILTDYIEKLMDTTWNNEGFFISEEFKETKLEDNMILVRLSQTFQMISMIDFIDKTNNIDKDKIIDFLNGEKNNKIDIPSYHYYINNCYLLLNNKDMINNEYLELDKIKTFVNKNSTNDSSLNEIYYLVESMKEYNINNNEIKSIVLDYTNKLLNTNTPDFQNIYKSLLINKTLLNNKIDNSTKTKINSYISKFKCNDIYSTITTYHADLKQMYVYYTTMKMLNDDISVYKEQVKLILENIDLNKLFTSELYEIYSYVQLNNLFDLKLIDGNIKNKIMDKISNYNIDDLNYQNISNFCMKIYILNSLNYNFTNKDLPNNMDNIINLIVNKNKPFESGKELSALMLLDAINITKSFDFNEKIINYITEIELSPDSEVLGYEIYYKNILLYDLNKKSNIDSTKELVNKLYSNPGYKANTKYNYFDPRISMLIYEILILNENGGDFYEIR